MKGAELRAEGHHAAAFWTVLLEVCTLITRRKYTPWAFTTSKSHLKTRTNARMPTKRKSPLHRDFGNFGLLFFHHFSFSPIFVFSSNHLVSRYKSNVLSPKTLNPLQSWTVTTVTPGLYQKTANRHKWRLWIRGDRNFKAKSQYEGRYGYGISYSKRITFKTDNPF